MTHSGNAITEGLTNYLTDLTFSILCYLSKRESYEQDSLFFFVRLTAKRGQVLLFVTYCWFSFLIKGFPPWDLRRRRQGTPAGEYLVWSCTGVHVSIAGDFSTVARNDNAYAWFYNVISTGVRTKSERSGEIPRGREPPPASVLSGDDGSDSFHRWRKQVKR